MSLSGSVYKNMFSTKTITFSIKAGNDCIASTHHLYRFHIVSRSLHENDENGIENGEKQRCRQFCGCLSKTIQSCEVISRQVNLNLYLNSTHLLKEFLLGDSTTWIVDHFQKVLRKYLRAKLLSFLY